MRALPFLLVGLTLVGCPEVVEPIDGGSEFDAGAPSDSGMSVHDAGLPDGGSIDAGADAGTVDAGLADAGSFDAGVPDAGAIDAGRTPLPPAPLVSADGGISITDAGYATSDLLGRDTLSTTLAHTLDGGEVIAVSAQSLVVAEGPACVLSQVNRYACDYRWISASGATLASVSNAFGGTAARGEVVMLYRDYRLECPDPFFANRTIDSAIPLMLDVETGATRLSWPRTESSALQSVMPEGDLIKDPNGERTCDAGAGFTFNPISTYRRVRAPYQQFVGVSAHELRDERLLLIDGGASVTRIEADGGRSIVVGNGPAAWVEVELDTFTLRRGDSFFRGDIDGGPLRPIATLSAGQQMGFEGGRFASITEVPDYSARRIIDTEGLMPDLRYPVPGSLLQRAPVLFGVDATNNLIVARVDQGTAATLPFTATASIYTWSHFPHDDAALVIDRSKVAWMIDTDGVKRVTDNAVNLPFRGFTTAPGAPNVVLLVRGPAPTGPFELLAVDRQTQRLVRLSTNVFVDLRPSYLGSCDVPGFVTPGTHFLFFAEPSAVAGQVDLFLVNPALTELPRKVGTTLASKCRVPVVSRDGTRVAVQETLGGPVTISVGSW